LLEQAHCGSWSEERPDEAAARRRPCLPGSARNPLGLEPGWSRRLRYHEGHSTCPNASARIRFVIRFVPGCRLPCAYLTYARNSAMSGTALSRRPARLANGTCESATHSAARPASPPIRPKGHGTFDAGVGRSRYADTVADWGGRFVGVDVTHAFDASFREYRPTVPPSPDPGGLFALRVSATIPFDLGHSIGVLHHNPSNGRPHRPPWRPTVRRRADSWPFTCTSEPLARHSRPALVLAQPRGLPARNVYVRRYRGPLYYLSRVPCRPLLFPTSCRSASILSGAGSGSTPVDWYSPPATSGSAHLPISLGWVLDGGFTRFPAGKAIWPARGKACMIRNP